MGSNSGSSGSSSSANNASMASSGFGMVLGFAGAEAEANAIKREQQFLKMQNDFNIKLAQINEEDAILRGEERVVDYKKQAAQIAGSQVASLAAQGVQIDTGSAAQVQYNTEKQIDTDIKRLKNNAWREAFGFKVEASQLQIQSMIGEVSSKNEISKTYLSAGLSAAQASADIAAKAAGGGS